MSDSPALLDVSNLRKLFPVTKGLFLKKTTGFVHAVDEISFQLRHGETFALVGESGSGKTTTAKLVMRMLQPTSGEIALDGVSYSGLKGKALFETRRKLGMVFQDPYSSLDPRQTVEQILREPLRVHKQGSEQERVRRIKELLEQVGLNPADMKKLPHQFSGGQRQRISIARAVALSPKLVIADEPVSALDVSVQAKIINLLMELRKKHGLSYLIIAHDLSVVKYISDFVIVMYLGKIVEMAPKDNLFSLPLHPYSKALMAAIPVPDPEYMSEHPPQLLPGETPSPIDIPIGCRFNNRCPYAQKKCYNEEPSLQEGDSRNHLVACHFWAEINDQTKNMTKLTN